MDRRLLARAFGTVSLFVVSLILNIAAAGAPEQRIQAVEEGLLPALTVKGRPAPTMKLAERMAHYRVPGVSIAVVSEGRLEWAKAYGVLNSLREEPVRANTLFQAASVSKVVAAVGALKLVESGMLGLDSDVNHSLRSWKLPASAFTRERKVTLRRLLRHTAGLNMPGFSGYASGEPVPSLIQVLEGSGPANSVPIRVYVEPDTVHSYSGGGYMVVQQVMEDVTAVPFAEYMRRAVLEKLAMWRSTFEQPLAERFIAEAAVGHTPTGEPMEGRWYTYPELAAAGLWTTPTELSRLVTDLQKSLDGSDSGLLTMRTAAEMVTDQFNGWGLGVSVGGDEGERWFNHEGLNRGYACRLFAFATTGQGAVVMTNSENGGPLIMEILRGIAVVYGWPDLHPEEMPALAVDPALYDRYAGRYAPVHFWVPEISVINDGDRLYADLSGDQLELLPITSAQYVSSGKEVEIHFHRDASGRVVELSLTVPALGIEDLAARKLE